ncbi:MAG: PH domain-containing protein [Anaerolineae bacterium]|nr:PH domain-containing protein [Anaerolineae bacterium]
MNWHPRKLIGLVCGLGLLVALAVVECSLLRGALSSPVNLALFARVLLATAGLAVALYVAHAWYGLARLTYRVERNGIVIRWAASYDVVPMAEIQRIEPVRRAGRKVIGGIGWPGYRFGQARLQGTGPVRLYVTQESGHALLIRTQKRCYLITPANVEGFLADYRARRLLGPIARWTEGRRLPPLLDPSIGRDPLARWLALPGLLLNLGLFGYLAAWYPRLAPRMVLSLDPRGLADRIGTSSELFLLPAVGLAILLVNYVLAACVHGRERVLALLLLCSVPVVQALAWVAASRLVM